MEKPLLSVIIPVYNAENTIEECLKSVLCQTYENLEIIIVDDFSNDKSPEIIKNFKDNRIVLIQNNKNCGAGESRNIGLKKATGKYIGFIDNDDFIEANYFFEMIKKLEEENADICVSLKITNHTENKIKSHLIKKDNLKKAVFIDRTAPWAKVIKTDFLKENNIRFDNSRGEDIFPAFLEAYLTDKITYIDNSSYHCRIRKDSISHQAISENDIEEIKLYKKIINYVKSDRVFWMKLIKERALISVNFLYENANIKLRREILKEYKKLFNSKYPYFEYQIFKTLNYIEKIKSHLRALIQHRFSPNNL